MTVLRRDIHDHAAGFDALLRDLAASVTCESIMTPWRDVERVTGAHSRETKQRATAMMDAGRYSSVPLIDCAGAGGAVRGRYIRWTPEGSIAFEHSQPHHFVAGATDAFSLLARMAEHKQIAMTVGDAQKPVGWITFADFSKRPFRLLAFVIVSEAEYLLARAIDQLHPKDGWLEFAGALPKDEVADLLKRRDEAREWDALMPLTTFADIGQLARVASASPKVCARLGLIEGDGNRLRLIADMRNRVAHTVRPVVAGPGAIQTTAAHVRLLRELIERWSAAIGE